MHGAKMKIPFSAYLLYLQEEIYAMFISTKITSLSKMFSHDFKLKTLSHFNASEDNTLSTGNSLKFKTLHIDGRIRILVDTFYVDALYQIRPRYVEYTKFFTVF